MWLSNGKTTMPTEPVDNNVSREGIGKLLLCRLGDLSLTVRDIEATLRQHYEPGGEFIEMNSKFISNAIARSDLHYLSNELLDSFTAIRRSRQRVPCDDLTDTYRSPGSGARESCTL